MPETIADIQSTLDAHNQGHLTQFVDELDEQQRQSLLSQLQSLDFDEIDRLIESYVRASPKFELPADIGPADFFPNDPASTAGHGPYDAVKFRNEGEAIIRAGKIAAFTVAGGQGTRLGWNGPKGTFPATAITGKPLFRIFAEQIAAAQKKYRITVPWYIMTSPINDEPTRAFFRDNNNFGLDRGNMFMFPQGVMPSFDADTGKLLLASKSSLAVNPDGHGGSLKGLAESGALEDMTARKIEHISYFQVDNPLVKIIDPLFIGLHASAKQSSAEMSSKMVPKTNASEKVGVFCQSKGKTQVVEYSDLPESYQQETDADGSLRYLAGSIAIHLMSVKFIDQLTSGKSFGLPWHRANKKVPHIDATGNLVEPAEPNGIKLEAFVFDAIPLAESSIVLETSRTEEFAPIKNAEGTDSAATSHQIQSNRNGKWLEANGTQVPRDADSNVQATIEISPLTALELDDLKNAELPTTIDKDAEVSL